MAEHDRMSFRLIQQGVKLHVLVCHAGVWRVALSTTGTAFWDESATAKREALSVDVDELPEWHPGKVVPYRVHLIYRSPTMDAPKSYRVEVLASCWDDAYERAERRLKHRQDPFAEVISKSAERVPQ